MNLKNHKKFIFIFASSFLFFCQLNAFSKEDFSISIEPSFGFSYGKLGEYLFNSNGTRILSYLEWNIKPAYNFDLNLALEFKKFKIYLETCYALPIKCGDMTDSDWTINDIKTHYGIFDNFITKKNYDLAIKCDYFIKINNLLSLSPLCKIRYKHLGFCTNQGIGWYSNNNSWETVQEPKKISHLECIQQSYFLFLGLQCAFTIKHFKINFSTFFNPLMLNYYIDYHSDENTNEIEEDYSTFVIQHNFFKTWNFDLKIFYEVTKKMSIFLNFDFLFFPKIYGLTGYSKGYKKETSAFFEQPEKWNAIGQITGNDFYSFSVKLGLKYYL